MEKIREGLSVEKILEENRRLLQENARLRRELVQAKEELTYDQITRLFQTQTEGRRIILEKMKRIHNEGRKISLIRLDINELKLWNARYGHDETDKILRILGQKLKEWAEAKGGVAMRFHFKGDEFGILLPFVNKDSLTKAVGELSDFSLEVPESVIACPFTIGFAYEGEPEVEEETRKLVSKEDDLSEIGRLFTALSSVADKRERLEEEKRKKING